MKILIIGCGWLGLPLAERLINENHQVYGSSTRFDQLSKLELAGINPFLYDGITTNQLPGWSKEIECAILNFPPSKSHDYPKQVADLLKQLSATCKIIFTSSTGVYEDIDGIVDELGKVKTDHPVFQAEEIVRLSNHPFIILRLAGLIGGERHPVKYMSGKVYPDGNSVVNLVQREDVIQAIIAVVEQNVWQGVYNVCYPEHPSKSDYYGAKATEFNILKPNFNFSDKTGKKIDGSRIENTLNFCYSNPL